SPLPSSAILSTAVRVNRVPATSVMVFGPPSRLAALTSAINSGTLAAVKLAGTVRSSSCSRVRRRSRRRGAGGRAGGPRQYRDRLFSHMVGLLFGGGLRKDGNDSAAGAQTGRRGGAGPAGACLTVSPPAACPLPLSSAILRAR